MACFFYRRAASSGGIDVHALNVFFNAYPESISLPDNRGMIPFHDAFFNKSSATDVVTELLKLYPESIQLIVEINLFYEFIVFDKINSNFILNTIL